jgi:hypothetical protein
MAAASSRLSKTTEGEVLAPRSQLPALSGAGQSCANSAAVQPLPAGPRHLRAAVQVNQWQVLMQSALPQFAL